MAITDLGLLGTGSSKSAATTLPVVNTTGAVIPTGTMIHVTGTWDNINSVTAPTITCSTIGGGTATANHSPAIGSGVTTTAGSGVWHQCFRALTTADIAIGATICTLTSDQSALVRAAHAEGWSGLSTTLRGTVATATSTTGSPSVATTGTALVTGDLVIGSVSYENNAQMTADADTLNGSWDAIVGTFTTGSTAATNVGTGSQDKTVTATGVQTYNPTGGVADTVACVYSLVPGPMIGTAALTASSTLTAVSTGGVAGTVPILTYTYEEGTEGAAASNGSNGVIALTAPAVYQAAAKTHGTFGMDLAAPALLAYTVPTTSFQASVYGKIATQGSAASSIAGIRFNATFLAKLRWTATRTFTITDSASTVVATSTSVLGVGEAYRADIRGDYRNGVDLVLSVRLYLRTNIEGTTPDETITYTFLGSTGPNRIEFGVINTSWVQDYDTLRIYNDLNDWPAPYAPPVTYAGAAALTATSTLSGTGTTAGGNAYTVTKDDPAGLTDGSAVATSSGVITDSAGLSDSNIQVVLQAVQVASASLTASSTLTSAADRIPQAAASLVATSLLSVGTFVVADTNLQTVPEPYTGLSGSGAYNSSSNGWGTPQPTTATYVTTGGPSVGNGTFKRFTALVAFTPPSQGVLMLQQIVISTTSGTLAVTPGDILTMSVYVRSSIAQSVAPLVQFLNSGGGGSSSSIGSDVVLTPNTWTRLNVTGTADGAAIVARMDIRAGVSNRVAWAINDTLDFTCAMVTAGSTLLPFYDGYSPITVTDRYAWTGTTGITSTQHSVLTPITREQFAVAPLTAASTLTSTATTTGATVQTGGAALTAASTLTSVAVREPVGVVALTAASTLTATAVRAPAGVVNLATTATLNATAIRQPEATIALVGVSTLTSTGTTTGANVQSGVVALAAVSTLTSAATITGQVTGAAALVGVSTLTSAAFTQHLLGPTDTTGLTDASTVVRSTGAITDDTGLTDVVSLSLTGPRALTQSPTDDAGLTDAGVDTGMAGAITDSTGLTDSVVIVLGGQVLSQSTTDNTGLTDAGTKTGISGAITDRAGLTDTVSVVRTPGVGGTALTLTINDSAGLDDSGIYADNVVITDDVAGLTDSVTVLVVRPSSAPLTAVSTLTANAVGSTIKTATAALTASSTLNATGIRSPQAAGSLLAVSQLTAGGLVTKTANVALSGVSALTATVTAGPKTGGAVLASSSTLSVSATDIKFATTTLTATSVLGGLGGREKVAVVTLVATSSLTAISQRLPASAMSFVATATMTVVAYRQRFAVVPLVATSTLGGVGFSTTLMVRDAARTGYLYSRDTDLSWHPVMVKG